LASVAGSQLSFGIATNAVAELIFLACVGAACIAMVAIAAATSHPDHVRAAGLFLIPLAGLVFFGGRVDLLHAVAAVSVPGINLLLSTIEDGGEMVSMPVACALARTISRNAMTIGRPP
jgi:hypothetical protein